MLSILKKIFGSKNERELKRLRPIVVRINELEPKMKKVSDEELARKTIEFKERISRGESLDEILPEAFAVVREASVRTIGLRHFDVQLIGGIVLHQGKIAEMKTGEGKTLVATLPLYLNALLGQGAHLVTVNDYLAKRDAEWMGPIYRFLGLSVGVIVHDMDDYERKKAYQADITYGTNNEFGFDYLRDNMKYSADELVQRELFYAIIDEVDSILIDEARTPLIISGPSEETTSLYRKINRIIPKLKRDVHYGVDEESRTCFLLEEGVSKVEELLHLDNLYDPRNATILHHLNQAIKAHALFKKDVDYVVKNGQVIIVDEFTGRLMPGRRYSDGLHQALEAKEGVKIESENQTLATITFQNFFRMYKKLAGMTGTADTEAYEFKKIYNLDVVVIPTHKPMIRIDYPDVIYKTEREKFRAVVSEIKELYKIGRPVLVGTTSIEKSERLSKMLKKEGIPHHVLNAKNHEKEAEIIAQAGRKRAVTISTNMAGRGTDIILGGNPKFLAKAKVRKNGEEFEKILKKMEQECEKEHKEVVSLGGLHIIGTERHESRRIDNQLRGRAGRQGDPGSSRFYLSLEDDLLRIFGGDRIKSIMERLGMEEGQPIEHKLVSKAIENAQRKVEAHNFEIRKTLLEYDDVLNKQREVIYSERKRVLYGEDLKKDILDMIDEICEYIVSLHVDEKVPKEEWDISGLNTFLKNRFNIEIENIQFNDKISLIQKVKSKIIKLYEEKEKEFGEENMRKLERIVYLQAIDTHWRYHLVEMDHLKEGIGLRGYGQVNPLHEYQREGLSMFQEMLFSIKEDTVTTLLKLKVVKEEELEVARKEQPIFTNRNNGERRVKTKKKKIGRNDPCPCGSGKKYKKCCGRKVGV